MILDFRPRYRGRVVAHPVFVFLFVICVTLCRPNIIVVVDVVVDVVFAVVVVVLSESSVANLEDVVDFLHELEFLDAAFRNEILGERLAVFCSSKQNSFAFGSYHDL